MGVFDVDNAELHTTDVMELVYVDRQVWVYDEREKELKEVANRIGVDAITNPNLYIKEFKLMLKIVYPMMGECRVTKIVVSGIPMHKQIAFDVHIRYKSDFHRGIHGDNEVHYIRFKTTPELYKVFIQQIRDNLK